MITEGNVALGVQGKRKDTIYACLMQDDRLYQIIDAKLTYD